MPQDARARLDETEPQTAGLELVQPDAAQVVTVHEGNIIALGVKEFLGTTETSQPSETVPSRPNAVIEKVEPHTTRKPKDKSERAMPDSVGQYLKEIGLTPLIDAAEERRLSQVMEKGRTASEKIERANLENRPPDSSWLKEARDGAEAKQLFIKANLRLVVSIARRYPLPPGLQLLDLIQDGNLGLEHAVDKFDWRKGFKLSTYATFWIRQAIGRGLEQKASIIRLPGQRSAALMAALRASSGDTSNLSEDQARDHRLTTPLSLDMSVRDDDSENLGAILPSQEIGPEEAIETALEYEALRGLLDKLSYRSRRAIELKMGFDGPPQSNRAIGEQLGVTGEAARRLIARALADLKDDAAAIISSSD